MNAYAKEKEFHFTDKHFNLIRSLVFEHTGISMSDAKSELIYSRLARRLRKLNIHDFFEYCEIIKSSQNKEEIGHFVNAVTTNLTSFFREEHHFEYLKNTILPKLEKRNSTSRRIRIWSAGCSTGKEPYSLAISIKECGINFSNWDIRILATDIDTNVLTTAKKGIYDGSSVDGLTKEQLKIWFQKGSGDRSDKIIASEKIKDLITFNHLNLMNEWPIKGMFDVIFCRNVVIYFNKETQKVLFKRFNEHMRSGSNLIIGHSESLFNVSNDYILHGKTIYEKK